MSKPPSYLQGRGRGRGWGSTSHGDISQPGVKSRGRGRSSRQLPLSHTHVDPQQRFENAAAKHQASIKQCTDIDRYSSSDSDSDLEIDTIMQSLTKQFKNAENGLQYLGVGLRFPYAYIHANVNIGYLFISRNDI